MAEKVFSITFKKKGVDDYDYFRAKNKIGALKKLYRKYGWVKIVKIYVD